MSNQLYQYAVLRYVHDPVTQEFINVGIVLYAAAAPYVGFLFNSRYRRLSDAFQQVNGVYIRTQLSAIERRVLELNGSWQRGNWMDRPRDMQHLLSLLIPADDSSLVFGGIGGGLAVDLAAEMNRLYERMVLRYAEYEEPASRDDAEVWQVFQRELSQRNVTMHLRPVTIVTELFSLDFQHAWKNERWHPLEAISFDLLHEASISNKAHRWIGHTLTLSHSEELGKLYLLLGSPRHEQLRRTFENEVTIMRQLMPPNAELVREEDAAEFSERLAREIAEH